MKNTIDEQVKEINKMWFGSDDPVTRAKETEEIKNQSLLNLINHRGYINHLLEEHKGYMTYLVGEHEEMEQEIEQLKITIREVLNTCIINATEYVGASQRDTERLENIL